jgi:hypothetical protein
MNDTTSAQLAQNPMLATGLPMSYIEKQVIWEDACNTILKDIANVFLSKSNQDKAGQQSDKDVFQAIGETIQNFPIPKFTDKPTTSDYVLLEVKEVLNRKFGNNIWLKGMYNDEVIYLSSDKHNSIKIRIEVVE